MIVWGSGGDVIDLGNVDTRRCQTCERDRPFTMVLQYRYWGLYWIFNFVTKKAYLLTCDVCNRGWEVEANTIERHLTAAPIPFMRRYGIVVLAGVVVGSVLLVSLSG